MGRNAVRVVAMSRSSRRASSPVLRGNCRSIPVSNAERVQRCARHRWNRTRETSDNRARQTETAEHPE
eukprot:975236-Prymnesium_polylepis.1